MKTIRSLFSGISERLNTISEKTRASVSTMIKTSLLTTLLVLSPNLVKWETKYDKSQQFSPTPNWSQLMISDYWILSTIDSSTIDLSKLSTGSVIDFLKWIWISDPNMARRKIIYRELKQKFDPLNKNDVYKWTIEQNRYIIDTITGIIKSKKDISNLDLLNSTTEFQLWLVFWIDFPMIKYKASSWNVFDGEVLSSCIDKDWLYKMTIRIFRDNGLSTVFTKSFESQEKIFGSVSFVNDSELQNYSFINGFAESSKKMLDILTLYSLSNLSKKWSWNVAESPKTNLSKSKNAQWNKKVFLSWFSWIVDSVKQSSWIDQIPTSLVLAQWVKESWWWTDQFAQKANNYLWMLDSKWRLLKFESVEESIKYYLELLTSKKCYKKFQRVLDKPIWIREKINQLTTALDWVYAEWDWYSQSLKILIAWNDLYKYDEK